MKITIKAIRGEAFAFEASEATTVSQPLDGTEGLMVLDPGGQGENQSREGL